MSKGLSVQNLWASYGRGSREAVTVKGVSFEVPAGSVLCLLGPSGCGKSTTLRCIAGLHTPTAGMIAIGNDRVYDGRRRVTPPDRRPIGMVFQSYALWPHKTVLDNVIFPLRTKRVRVGKDEARSRALEALQIMGLGESGGSYPWALSGGQQQRVALARALVAKPDLLLLDEPLSNLDSALRGEMREFIKNNLTDLSLTAVFVTHDHEEALALGDEIAVMQEGSIVEHGTPEQLYRTPRTAIGASAVGQANVLNGVVETVYADRVAMKTEWGSIECEKGNPEEVFFSGSTATVFFRPEHSAICTDSGAPLMSGRLRGTLQSSQFLGNAWEYRVRNGEELLSLRGGESSLRPQVGDDVVLTITKARVFRKPGNEALTHRVPVASADGRETEYSQAGVANSGHE